jgi:hypothetical protein
MYLPPACMCHQIASGVLRKAATDRSWFQGLAPPKRHWKRSSRSVRPAVVPHKVGDWRRPTGPSVQACEILTGIGEAERKQAWNSSEENR